MVKDKEERSGMRRGGMGGGAREGERDRKREKERGSKRKQEKKKPRHCFARNLRSLFLGIFTAKCKDARAEEYISHAFPSHGHKRQNGPTS